MPIFWRRFQNYRKQKRLNRLFWEALRQPAPHLEKLRALVQAGADVNCNEPGTGAMNYPPLAFAARRSHCTADTVQFLLENGAEVARLNEMNPNPRYCHLSPLLPSVANGGGGDSDKKFHLLFEAGADVNAYDAASGRSVLWELTLWASIPLIKSALKKGANPNGPAFGKHDWKPLHVAAYLGRAEAVTVYLRYGADPLARDKNGDTPRGLAETEKELSQTVGRGEPHKRKPLPHENFGECVRLLRVAEAEAKKEAEA